jgi:hypothetical protein
MPMAAQQAETLIQIGASLLPGLPRQLAQPITKPAPARG